MDSVNEVATALEQMKNWATESEKKAIDYVLSAMLKESPEYKYRMVRSHTPNCYKPHDDLDKYLAAGYEFVSASDFIPLGDGKSGYIEYILRKKKEDGNE